MLSVGNLDHMKVGDFFQEILSLAETISRVPA